MADDNGALITGAVEEGGCPTCVETATVQCGVEQSNQGCSTPYCDPKLATLPKTQAGRIVTRKGECLYDTPSTALGKNQVWVRTKDGRDIPCDLTPDMVPAKADAPCFRTIDEAEADTYGTQLMSQVDEETGKKCIKEVPLEDTDEAFLSGLQAEPVCSGTPKIRPKRIIPEDIAGCPDNIRILAAVEETEEVQPGLNKVKTLWRWLKNIVLSDANLEVREGDEEDGACVLPAVWVRNGECSTLAKAQLADGVLGAWAYCGGCLRFYELPESGTGYDVGVVLVYVGGDECWEWQQPGTACTLMLDTPVEVNTSVTAGTKTIDISSYEVPDCSKFAILSITLVGDLDSGSGGSFVLNGYMNATAYAPLIRVNPPLGGYDSNAGLVQVPIIGTSVKLEVVRSGVWDTLTSSVNLCGFC